MIKAAIFDFDGVISDTLPSFFEWMKHITQLTGRVFPYKKIEEFKPMIEDPYRPMYTKLGFDWEVEKEFLHQEFRNYMTNRHNPCFPGIKRVIKKLHRKGIELAIASSNRSEKINQELCGYGLWPYFKSIVGKEQVTTSDGIEMIKPYPICLLLALDNLNCSPLEAIYFGDQPVDVIAARGVSDFLEEAIPVVGVTYGFAPKEKLLAANPDMYINKPEDILKII